MLRIQPHRTTLQRRLAPFATALALSASLSAQEVQQAAADPAASGAQREVPQTHRQGDITWLSGGVGKHERDSLRKLSDRFNLKLIFIEPEPDQNDRYLSQINVALANPQGEVLVETDSSGPWFFAEVPPGNYRLQVSGPGETFDRTVDVPADGLRDVVFFWP